MPGDQQSPKRERGVDKQSPKRERGVGEQNPKRKRCFKRAARGRRRGPVANVPGSDRGPVACASGSDLSAGGARVRGFTLIELVLSVAIMAILMTGIGSAILIASHALPVENTSGDALVRVSEVVDQMSGELNCALTFTEYSATIIEFEVPDRNADLASETIRYAWSGIPGDPLTRQYNAGSVVNVADDVQEFALDYDLKTVTEQPDPITNESPELVLSSHTTAAAAADYATTDKLWIGQYFFPSLPPDTITWNVTRVSFPARIHGGTNGITAVQLRLPTVANLPGTTVLEEVAMYESNLSASYRWEEFSFSTVSQLSPTQGLCLVLAMIKKDTHLADIQYDSGGGSGRLTTINAGSPWLKDVSKSMLYCVYGTVTTRTTPDPVTRTWLRSVGISLRVGNDPSGRVETGAQILNFPEVTGP